MQLATYEEASAAYLAWQAEQWLIEGGPLPPLVDALAERIAQILQIQHDHGAAIMLANLAIDDGAADREKGPLGGVSRMAWRIGQSANRMAKYQREKDLVPFLRYVCDHYRTHSRLNHAALHNVILPIDHPVWHWMFPPNGWGCNCRVEQVSEARMQREGWSVTQEVEAQFDAQEIFAFGQNWAELWPDAANKKLALLTF